MECFFYLGNSSFKYNINTAKKYITLPVIVICPINPTPVFGFHRQFAYKKFVQYKYENHTEVVKTLKNLQRNKNEFWYTSGEIIIWCSYMSGEYYECDYGNSSEVVTELSAVNDRKISVTLKGILTSLNFMF